MSNLNAVFQRDGFLEPPLMMSNRNIDRQFPSYYWPRPHQDVNLQFPPAFVPQQSFANILMDQGHSNFHHHQHHHPYDQGRSIEHLLAQQPEVAHAAVPQVTVLADGEIAITFTLNRAEQLSIHDILSKFEIVEGPGKTPGKRRKSKKLIRRRQRQRFSAGTRFWKV